MKEQIIILIRKLLDLNLQLLANYIKNMDIQTYNGIRVYECAKSLLGKDASPLDNAPDSFACAETVNYIVSKATGKEIGGGTSTNLMYGFLQDVSRFIKIENPLAGDIIISPSGYSSKGFPHGHVGIIGKYGILSNNSEDGKLEENYTLDVWKKIYGDAMGFPVEVYRII